MIYSIVEPWISLEVLQVFLIISGVNADFYTENFPASVIEDALLNTTGFLTKYKYPVETHKVITEDKYILTVHRIPKPQGHPVFLMHGLVDSSATWLLMGPSSGLGYYLHDEGFDIWMGNARGNIYSREHSSLNPNSSESYWKFSFHEIGFYDLPAMIDYILTNTNNKKLTYVGHSQGTTSFFIMSSMRPSYNGKIHSMHALSPVAFMKNLPTPLLPIGGSLVRFFKGKFLEVPPLTEFFSSLCFQSNLALNSCIEVFVGITGRESKRLNATMWPVVFGHIPAGVSFRQILHYYQLVNSGYFRAFDYGDVENLRRYGKASPPDYAIKNITAPLALYYSNNDFLSSDVDVKRLIRLLPNVIEDRLLPQKDWGHLSFLWGINVRKILFRRMLAIMRRFL